MKPLITDAVETKPCSKCGGIERHASGRCAVCARASVRKWRMNNKAAVKAIQQRWQRNHPEICAENNRKWRSTHPGAQSEAVRKWNMRHPHKQKIYKTKWRDRHPDAAKASGRRSARRGWAPGEHERAEMERKFITGCACCGSPDSRHQSGWAADHDHVSGLFRGYLCHPCNVRIGFAEKYNLGFSPEEKIYLAKAVRPERRL